MCVIIFFQLFHLFLENIPFHHFSLQYLLTFLLLYSFPPSDLNIFSQELKPPLSFKDIFGKPDEKEWLKAVEEELNNMKNKNVYTLVKNILDEKILISIEWVFSYKRDDKGNIVKYIVRLVVRGFSQKNWCRL